MLGDLLFLFRFMRVSAAPRLILQNDEAHASTIHGFINIIVTDHQQQQQWLPEQPSKGFVPSSFLSNLVGFARNKMCLPRHWLITTLDVHRCRNSRPPKSTRRRQLLNPRCLSQYLNGLCWGSENDYIIGHTVRCCLFRVLCSMGIFHTHQAVNYAAACRWGHDDLLG